ncbi:MAG TPA: hypothetical protein VK177_18385 [Flavobacteriales bacterium]|nr:hypothetical protein [Flavobacteriales bacterium]
MKCPGIKRVLVLCVFLFAHSKLLFAQNDNNDSLEIKTEKDTLAHMGRFKLAWHLDFVMHPVLTLDNEVHEATNYSIPFSAFVGWLQPISNHLAIDFGIETAFRQFKSLPVTYVDEWQDTIAYEYIGRVHSVDLPMGMDFFIGKKTKFGTNVFLAPRFNLVQHHNAIVDDLQGNRAYVERSATAQYRLFNMEVRGGIFVELPTNKRKKRAMRFSALGRSDLLDAFTSYRFKNAWSYGFGIEFVF